MKDTTRRRTILKTVKIQNNNNMQNDAQHACHPYFFFNNTFIQNLIFVIFYNYIPITYILKYFNFVCNLRSTLLQNTNIFIFQMKNYPYS